MQGQWRTVGKMEQSIEEHMKAMSVEMDKSRPNIDQIESRMQRTLHAGTDLYKNKAAEVLQQCPFLKVPRLLLYEMELRFGQDVDANLTGFLHSSAGRNVESTKGPQHALLTSAIAEADQLKAKEMVSIKMDGCLVIGPSPDIDATLGLDCLFALYFLFQVR
ncbi:hypothetical protein SKAU_G00241400 [Synaphobranchus kaupii]|uniref:Uncharacterized protein n=1 Tax=Synaphobranchus kaupii TaxID=118154 RepID=A0A9Q1F844_SYNKA|nr:hypothetical protein SKAU_G00241400 [Synaphobranchus kaupii]